MKVITKNIKFERRLPAVAVIFNDKGEVLLSQRFGKEENWHLKWQFPGGGIEFGENPKDTAIRETMEEVGIRINVLSNYPIVFNHKVDKTKTDYICFAYPAKYVGGKIDTGKDDSTSDAKWFRFEDINFENCLPLTKELIDEARKFLN